MNVCTTTLQKVLAPRTPTRRYGSFVVGHGAEDLEIGLQILAEVHDGSDVAAAVTVIWCRPNGNDVFVFEVVLWELAWIFRGIGELVTYFVAFVDELMCASDELEAVDVVELEPVSGSVQIVIDMTNLR